ncbi:MAG: TetR/AcrR family transcriptional regulator [Haloechinothrix sp.]
MPRLSRSESQARTRESLLATARELFMRDGYQATSVATVADAAGFSTGAVYSNFDGKTGLALAVLDQIHAEQLAEVSRIFAANEGIDSKLTAFEEWAEAAMSGGWPRLELEFALDAKQETALVEALVDRERGAVDAIAVALRRYLEPLGLADSIPVRTLAGAMLSLGIGVAIQRMVDPRVSVSGLIDLLRVALAAVNSPAR